MAIAPTLNIPQAKFLAMQYKFKAYVAGFGSGKTWVGCGGICKGMWEHPKINQGFTVPTTATALTVRAVLDTAGGAAGNWCTFDRLTLTAGTIPQDFY